MVVYAAICISPLFIHMWTDHDASFTNECYSSRVK